MKEILLFVEDPGAVNMILDLPNQLKNRAIKLDVIATNHAIQILKKKSIKFTEINNINQLNSYLINKNYSAFLVGTSENKESLAFSIIDLAKKKNILSVAIIDMLSNSNSRFSGISKNPLNHKPDKLIVTDSQTYEKFKNMGIKDKDIFVCQHPQEERINNKKETFGKVFKRRKEESKRWLFVAENIDLVNPSESYYSQEYGFKGRGTCSWRTGIILEEIIDCLKDINFKHKLIVRLHPKNKIDQFDKWQNEVSFDEISDPLESIWCSDVVLGMSSNLLVEAMILEKPVISILPRVKEIHWMSELETNAIKSIFSRTELRVAFNSLANENYDLYKSPFIESRRNKIRDIICNL